ncbi:MAG: GNAT family N-acetyltransferase [Methanocellales archaeon]
MGEYKVELLAKNDAREIEALLKDVWPNAIEYPEEWRRKRTLSEEQIIKEMESGYFYFGIRIAGKIAGIYKASIQGDAVFGEHQSIPEIHRGKGLATAMYEHIINFAREKKCKRILVNILVGQVASRKCVEKFGFQKKGEPYEQARGMLVQMYEKLL